MFAPVAIGCEGGSGMKGIAEELVGDCKAWLQSFNYDVSAQDLADFAQSKVNEALEQAACALELFLVTPVNMPLDKDKSLIEEGGNRSKLLCAAAIRAMEVAP